MTTEQAIQPLCTSASPNMGHTKMLMLTSQGCCETSGSNPARTGMHPHRAPATVGSVWVYKDSSAGLRHIYVHSALWLNRKNTLNFITSKFSVPEFWVALDYVIWDYFTKKDLGKVLYQIHPGIYIAHMVYEHVSAAGTMIKLKSSRASCPQATEHKQ